MISQGPSICIFNKDDSGEVLASWLFAQYLLTNETQIAYSQTEGYVPVTLKAQNTDVYQDYLSREGEDNDLYYHIKLKATKLLLKNMDNTFITPVFNGSASLRNAAGSLIEETGKAVNRGVKITDSQLENTFKRVQSLYKLGEFTQSERGKGELGRMPAVSVALLSGIGIVWVGIGVYAYCDYRKKRRLPGQKNG
jgi:multiple sugar transport system substrate-binding protein